MLFERIQGIRILKIESVTMFSVFKGVRTTKAQYFLRVSNMSSCTQAEKKNQKKKIEI